jgi:hypothetical protein
MMAALALVLLAAAVPAATADYLQTTFFPSTTDCSGSFSQKVFSSIGCLDVGSGLFATLSCTSSTTARFNLFTTPQCTGSSTPSNFDFNSTCAAGGSSSSQQQVCVSGALTTPPGVASTIYSQ